MSRKGALLTRRQFLRGTAAAAIFGCLRSGTPMAAAARANAPTLVLVHSPLVGPVFWEPAAGELRNRGWQCVIPTVQSKTETVPAWHEWPRRLSEASNVAAGAYIVGHSGAGLLLPALAQLLDARGLIFVDAQLPPASGTVPPAEPEFLTFIRTLPVVDGRLPRWSEWWGGDVLSTVIPDAQARKRFQQSEPRLTPTWFDDTVDVPEWSGIPASYVQTSTNYSAQAQAARERGWPVTTLQGTHLHAYVTPAKTADAIHAAAQHLADHAP